MHTAFSQNCSINLCSNSSSTTTHSISDYLSTISQLPVTLLQLKSLSVYNTNIYTKYGRTTVDAVHRNIKRTNIIADFSIGMRPMYLTVFGRHKSTAAEQVNRPYDTAVTRYFITTAEQINRPYDTAVTRYFITTAEQINWPYDTAVTCYFILYFNKKLQTKFTWWHFTCLTNFRCN